MPPPMGWVFGEFELDTDAFELRRNGEAVPSEPQVLSLLALLVENHDRLVTKEEIVERIWDGRAISDAAISSRIKSARQLIGDDGKQQTHIRTVHGRGFRFVADAKPPQGVELKPRTQSGNGSAAIDPAVVPPTTSLPARDWRYPAALGIAFFAALTIIAVLFGVTSGFWASDEEDGIRLAVVPFSAPGEDDFGREIAASLVTGLSERNDFTMLSSTSSFSLAERGMTSAQIIEELGATHLVEGDISRSEGQIKVDLRLIEGKTQHQIWTRSAKENPELSARLVDKVRRRVAAGVQAYLEVGGGEVDIPDGTEEDAIRDYRLALESYQYYYSTDRALSRYELYDSARTKAPDWADAHGAFAFSAIFSEPAAIARDFPEHKKIIEEAIAKALEIDPKNRQGRLAEGVFKTRYGTDLAEAIALLEKLVSDEPNWPLAHRMYAQALLVGGHYREAAAQFDQIDALNSLPTYLGGFIRSHALKGMGRPMNNKSLALACEAQCFWYFSGWYDAILVEDYSTEKELDAALDELTVAMRKRHQDTIGSFMGLGQNLPSRMEATARYLAGFGPEPHTPYGRVPSMIALTLRQGGPDAVFDYLAPFKLDWVPANATFELFYDDKLKTPERVISDSRYASLLDRPNLGAVVAYRRSHGLLSGLPKAD